MEGKTLEQILAMVESLDNNWMHKTKCEKVTGIREILWELDHSIYDGKISGTAPCDILGEVNKLMLKLHDAVAED